MNVDLQQEFLNLFNSISQLERKRNTGLSPMANKILSTLAQIRCVKKEEKNQARRIINLKVVSC